MDWRIVASLCFACLCLGAGAAMMNSESAPQVARTAVPAPAARAASPPAAQPAPPTRNAAETEREAGMRRLRNLCMGRTQQRARELGVSVAPALAGEYCDCVVRAMADRENPSSALVGIELGHTPRGSRPNDDGRRFIDQIEHTVRTCPAR